LGTLQLVRGVEALHPAREVLRTASIRLDLGLEAEGAEVAGIAEPREEVVGELLRLGHDRRQVASVVFETTLLALVQAPPDPEHDQDQEHHDHADAGSAANHDLTLANGVQRGRV